MKIQVHFVSGGSIDFAIPGKTRMVDLCRMAEAIGGTILKVRFL